jgi:D-alanyl-D-alanine carboxypeptidase
MNKLLAHAISATLVLGLVAAAASPAHSARPASQASQATAGQASGGRAAHIVATARLLKRDNDLHAVIFGVWIDGRPLVVSALGQSLTDQPATTDMHFRIGAMAIPYLTTVLLQLVQEKRVSLSDKLSRWLPRVPHASQVTLGELAASRSGYHDYEKSPALIRRLYANPFQYFSQPYLLSLAVTKPLLYRPGTSWSYAHTNFVLLGEALSKITGQPLAELIQDRILRPLDLQNTFSSVTPYITPPVLQGYDSERGVYEDTTYWNPSWSLAHGAIMTSDIEDMGQTAIAVGTGQLLSRTSYRQMIAPRSLITPPGQPKVYYGLGVAVDDSWIVQNPLLPGYNGVFAYLPSAKIAIAAVSTVGKLASSSTNYAFDLAKAVARYLVPSRPLH